MLGPQKRPKSVRAVEAEVRQRKVEIDELGGSYVMPDREEIQIYTDTGNHTKNVFYGPTIVPGPAVFDARRVMIGDMPSVNNGIRYSSGTDWSCVERALEVFRSGYSGSIV